MLGICCCYSLDAVIDPTIYLLLVAGLWFSLACYSGYLITRLSPGWLVTVADLVVVLERRLALARLVLLPRGSWLEWCWGWRDGCCRKMVAFTLAGFLSLLNSARTPACCRWKDT